MGFPGFLEFLFYEFWQRLGSGGVAPPSPNLSLPSCDRPSKRCFGHLVYVWGVGGFGIFSVFFVFFGQDCLGICF